MVTCGCCYFTVGRASSSRHAKHTTSFVHIQITQRH